MQLSGAAVGGNFQLKRSPDTFADGLGANQEDKNFAAARRNHAAQTARAKSS